MIAALALVGNTASPSIAALLRAVEMLRELNVAGRTTVPDEATTVEATSFVPARWRGYTLMPPPGQGRGAAFLHYWELSVLYGVRAGLRSGDLLAHAAAPIQPCCCCRRLIGGPVSATTSAR